MRILIIGVNYAPEVAGIGPYTTELAEHLVGDGRKVSVLTGFPYYPQWKVDPAYRHKWPFTVGRINGVRVLRCPFLLPRAKQTTFRRILFDTSLAVTSLIASVAVGRVDLVICVSPPLQLGITAWLISRTRRARLVLHLQDLVPDAALSVGMMREGSAVRLARRLERFVYSRADRITVISRGFLDNLVAKGVAVEKLLLLPNWVETSRFNVSSNQSVRNTLGARNGEMLVVHAGNMGAKQGLETVIDAAAELASDDIFVALIGDGSHRRELEARASRLGLKNVKFVPLQEDFPRTLAAADLLVLSQQGRVVDSVVPSKLLGYMASGRAVVAAVNDHSEAARIIRDAKSGRVVPPENPTALAAAIRELRYQHATLSQFGVVGRRYVIEHYEKNLILERWSREVEEHRFRRPS